jgi:opacity protein-like surface antigen
VSSTNGIPNGVSTVGDTSNQFAYKLSAGTLFSLTEQLSLDVSYQYVNLGEFEEGTEVYRDGLRRADLDAQKGANGGEIKTQELMVGLQYTFK